MTALASSVSNLASVHYASAHSARADLGEVHSLTIVPRGNSGGRTRVEADASAGVYPVGMIESRIMTRSAA
jgi:hypothetical protein